MCSKCLNGQILFSCGKLKPNSAGNQGCAEKRNVRMQKFIFSSDGIPILGEPVAIGLQINKPSGDK